jgi:proteasome assembly chaperone 3
MLLTPDPFFHSQMHVPLSTPTDTTSTSTPYDAHAQDYDDDDEQPSLPSELLPMPHLTATTVLGGTHPGRATVAQLVATQVASIIVRREPTENRVLVVGLGLRKESLERTEFVDLVDAIVAAL